MPSSRLFLYDGLTDQPVRLATDDTIVVSSDDAGWDGIALERQSLPPNEPDGYMPWHLLSVLITPPTRYVDFTGGRSHTVPQLRGDVVYRPAGVVTRAAWDGTVDTINVALSPESVDRVAAEMLDGGSVELADSYFGADSRVFHLAHALLHGLESGAATGLFVDSVRTALAAHLVGVYGRLAAPSNGPGLTKPELQRVRDLVEARLSEPLRLADLAAAVPMSPYHFSRAFKSTTGITVHEFVLRRRVEAARTLLERGGLLVAEVARRTGFTDASHLARHFRRRVGMSPARYARVSRRSSRLRAASRA
ncbi:AraC family transcriptional regulator [Mycobacterium sp.]|uniref:AraC family transcriptional regulator n=1 Tax=Mycobacterium sp. TaxID=1785 RepID=UPI002D9926B7|nr:AraC family transcriptional regulator [Mycobacterium sp.]